MKEVKGDTNILDIETLINGYPIVSEMPNEFVLVLAKELCEMIAWDSKE